MKARMILLSVALLVSAAAAWAQHPPERSGPPHPPGPAEDPLSETLFPPELVMRHQSAVGLAPEQKTYLREQIRQAQLRFTELQWQLQDAMESLRGLLEQTPVAEEQVLAQLEKVLEAERTIKRTQLTLMIRIKNKLTPEQQARLRELRPRAPAPPHPPAPPLP